jgi:uncharacterized protein YndB with AHSA1/START domain
MRTFPTGGQTGAGPAGIGIALQRRFRASPDRVFRAWTEPAALREWWCPAGWVAGEIAIDPRPGGTYRIEMRRSGGGERLAVRGEFLDVMPPWRLVYSWIWEGAFPETAPTLVTVEIDGSPDETLLTLRHDDFTDAGIREQHRTGWIAACNRLDRVVTPAGGLSRHSGPIERNRPR